MQYNVFLDKKIRIVRFSQKLKIFCYIFLFLLVLFLFFKIPPTVYTLYLAIKWTEPHQGTLSRSSSSSSAWSSHQTPGSFRLPLTPATPPPHLLSLLNFIEIMLKFEADDDIQWLLFRYACFFSKTLKPGIYTRKKLFHTTYDWMSRDIYASSSSSQAAAAATYSSSCCSSSSGSSSRIPLQTPTMSWWNGGKLVS